MQTAFDWREDRRRVDDLQNAPSSAASAAPSWPLDRWTLRQIHRHVNDPAVALTLWDGTRVGPPPDITRATVWIADRPTLYRVLRDPEVGFGDAYSDGRLEVTGDLIHLLQAAYRAPESSLYRHARMLTNTPGRARDNVHAHYDLGNDFYELWLDREMVYTCAYYARPDLTLEQAQLAKLDLVCRKLDLRPGMRVVDAGSGWGALALYMARHYGVTVTAYNVSREQIAYAKRRAVEIGLAERVRFIEDDYRAITGTFDRFASIGMLEHVGTKQYAALGTVIDRVLDRRHGRGLLHFIGRNQAAPLSRWITKRIFPGAYAPTLAEACDGVLAPWRLSVLDVENLRLHYARTLEDWSGRYEAARAEVEQRHGPRFARAWRLYLLGSQVTFAAGYLQLFQLTFARQQDNGLPLTRARLYATAGQELP
jgi:cyclopropane-fatty-acyl-phospholipid synthase